MSQGTLNITIKIYKAKYRVYKKKVNPYKYKLAIAYCINLTDLTASGTK